MKYIFGLNLSFIFTTTPVFERKCEFSTSCFDCWCCRPEGCNPERYNGAVLSSEDRLAVEFPPAASGNVSDIGQGSSKLLPKKFVSLEVQHRYSRHINRQCLVRGPNYLHQILRSSAASDFGDTESRSCSGGCPGSECSWLSLLTPGKALILVEERKTNLMSLAILFHFLCAQHVSDINISITRILRLCC